MPNYHMRSQSHTFYIILQQFDALAGVLWVIRAIPVNYYYVGLLLGWKGACVDDSLLSVDDLLILHSHRLFQDFERRL